MLPRASVDWIQYYIQTKTELPLDIEFAIQDTFAVTRPQWKMITNLEEAAKAFQAAVMQDQKTAGADKAAEFDDDPSGPSSDEENGDDNEVDGDGDDDDSASEEEDVEVCDSGNDNTLSSI